MTSSHHLFSVVAGGSHCADMGPLDPERDSPSMAIAKVAHHHSHSAIRMIIACFSFE